MSFLNLYILLNFILSIAAIVSMGLCKFLKWKNRAVSSAQILFLNYSLLLISVVSFFSLFLFPEEEISSPMPQQFSSKVIEFKGGVEAVLIESSIGAVSSADINYLRLVSTILFLIIFYKLAKLMFEVAQTFKSFKHGLLFKKIGQVSIYLSSRYSVPYAFSFLGQSFVSLPEKLIEDSESFKIALKHEVQHIRNKDTGVAILMELLKSVFFLNWPLIKWMNVISLEQEFSCDETLILKRGVLELDYKKCLLKVANFGRCEHVNLVGATRFIFSDSRSELSRRIQKMSKVKTRVNKWSMALLIAGFISVISTSAYTFKVHASLGSLSMGEVKSLVKEKDFSKDFPVDINKDVVKWVNKYARSSKGAKYTKKALSNYYGYKDIVDKHIKDYGHPKELAAVPFVESMYQNLEQPKGRSSAGLWQFIPSTARIYNLRVGENLDERLDVIKETDAAMRYLGALNLRFQDWRLAMLSYNAGETEVQRVVNKTKSRDAWKIVKNDLKYDKDYLAKVIAASIVMKYPEIVK